MSRQQGAESNSSMPPLAPASSPTTQQRQEIPTLPSRNTSAHVLMSPALLKASKEASAKQKAELLPWAPAKLKELQHTAMTTREPSKSQHLPRRHTQLHRKLKKLVREVDDNNVNALMWAAKLMQERQILCQGCMAKCKRAEIMLKLVEWHLDQNPSFLRKFVSTFADGLSSLLYSESLLLRQLLPDQLLERHLSADGDRLSALLQSSSFLPILAGDLTSYAGGSLAAANRSMVPQHVVENLIAICYEADPQLFSRLLAKQGKLLQQCLKDHPALLHIALHMDLQTLMQTLAQDTDLLRVLLTPKGVLAPVVLQILLETFGMERLVDALSILAPGMESYLKSADLVTSVIWDTLANQMLLNSLVSAHQEEVAKLIQEYPHLVLLFSSDAITQSFVETIDTNTGKDFGQGQVLSGLINRITQLLSQVPSFCKMGLKTDSHLLQKFVCTFLDCEAEPIFDSNFMLRVLKGQSKETVMKVIKQLLADVAKDSASAESQDAVGDIAEAQMSVLVDLFASSFQIQPTLLPKTLQFMVNDKCKVYAQLEENAEMNSAVVHLVRLFVAVLPQLVQDHAESIIPLLTDQHAEMFFEQLTPAQLPANLHNSVLRLTVNIFEQFPELRQPWCTDKVTHDMLEMYFQSAQKEVLGEGEQKAYQKKRTVREIPLNWEKYLNGKLTTKEDPYSDRQLYEIAYKIYDAKIKADAIDLAENNDPDEMPEFCIEFMLFQYGARSLVRPKLRVLIKSINQYKDDPNHPWIQLFARFCGFKGEMPSSDLLGTFLWGLAEIQRSADRGSRFTVVDNIIAKKIKKQGGPSLCVAFMGLASAKATLKRLTVGLDFDIKAEYSKLDHRAFHMEGSGKVVDTENILLPFATALLEQERKEREALRTMFREADTDNSNLLEYNEFVAMIERVPLLKNISDHEICRLYNTATDHGDIDIDEERFVRVASRDWKKKLQIDVSQSALADTHMHFEQLCSSKIKSMFDKYDQSSDGVINAEELSNLLSDIGKKVNDAELQTIHRIIDMDGSGLIDFVEFMEWWREHGLHAVFAQHDEDNSGELTAAELQVMLRDLGVECTDTKLQQILSEVDEDGSGAVGYAEFVRWWSTFDTQVAFSKYDADQSGEISIEELDTLLRDLGRRLAPDKLHAAVKALDQDGSGSLSFHEFLPWFKEIEKTQTREARSAAFGKKRQNEIDEASYSEMLALHTQNKTYLKLSVQGVADAANTRAKLHTKLQMIGSKYGIDPQELIFEFGD